VKVLHAKIGELTLEVDFLAGALGKAGREPQREVFASGRLSSCCGIASLACAPSQGTGLRHSEPHHRHGTHTG
jgi:hypothetical protein